MSRPQGSRLCGEARPGHVTAAAATYSLPLIELPHLNPSHLHNGRGEAPGRTVFTSEILQIIHRIDEAMFSEFGYSMRDEPFELS